MRGLNQTVSASREKKDRQDLSAQGPSEKNMKQKREDADAKRNRTIYTILGVLFGAAAIALLVYGSGFFQSRATAVTIDGQKFTAADLEFHYQMVYNEAYTNSMYAAMGYGTPNGFDYSQSPKDQIYEELNMSTWHDHFVEEAKKSLTQHVALENAANAEGFVLPEEGKQALENSLSSLEDQWRSNINYTSRAGYLKAVYGPYMTYDVYKTNLERSVLAQYYVQDYVDNLEFTQEEQEAYYKEHADELDTFTMTQFVFRATVPDEETDAEGNTIERTEEEEAQLLEQAKQDCKADADAVYAALEAGEDPQTLADQYETYSFVQDDVRLGSSVNSAYQEWAYDSARKPGDLHQAEYDGGTSYSYYVVRFEDRQRDETPSADVRHILVGAAESNVSPTEEQFAEAKTKAEELLAQWKAGEATEDSFAALAQENSADTGSATNGGMISGITPYSGYVETFSDWALDPARKVGDTGIVQNTGSSVQGWHIMYLAAQGGPYWMMEAQSVLSKEAQESWLTERTDSVSAVDGSGLKYV